MAVMWGVSDWPVHDLAEGYLYSVHMAQHLTLTLVVAPLLLLGTPAWLARRLLSPPGLLKIVRALSRPVPGAVPGQPHPGPEPLAGGGRGHPPPPPAALRGPRRAAGLGACSCGCRWSARCPRCPGCSRRCRCSTCSCRRSCPTVPASFLTFGKKPLYPIYETFPRLWDISALNDQLFAGLIMKVGGRVLPVDRHRGDLLPLVRPRGVDPAGVGDGASCSGTTSSRSWPAWARRRSSRRARRRHAANENHSH